MSKKISTILIVSIIVIVASLLAVFLWRQKKDTGYSNIYTNQKYSFQISVPQEYLFKPSEMADTDIGIQFKTNDVKWMIETREPGYTAFFINIWDKNLYDKEAEKKYGLNSNYIPRCVVLGQNNIYVIEACFPNSGAPEDLGTFIDSLCCSSENVKKVINFKFLND